MDLTMQTELFKKTAKEKAAWNKKVKDITAQARKLEAEIEEIKTNKIFENAFEWRFEFPEVLDDAGTFVGFDAVIGNPPFIQIQNFSGNPCQIGWQEYKTYAKTGDVFCLFYERGYHLLKERGLLTLISSNKWMRAGYGKAMRKYLLENGTMRTLIDFGDVNIFESATTYTNILIWEKTLHPRTQQVPICYDLNGVYEKEASLVDMIASAGASDCLLNEDAYVVISPEWTQLKRRVEALGKSLSGWNLAIYRGILTGCNEAFIVNGKKRAELIAEDPRSVEILKPILRGRDIKRYAVQFADLWMIDAHNGYTDSAGKRVDPVDIRNDYRAIRAHLQGVNGDLNGRVEARADQGMHWTNLRNCAYHEEFSKAKLIYAEIVYDSAFYFDAEGYAPEATSFIMTGDRVKYLAAFLNSRFLTEIFKRFYAGGDLRGNTFRYKKTFLEPLPVPELDEDGRRPFEILVDCVQFARSQAMTQEAEQIEAVIDGLVYDFYFEQEMRTANCFVTDRITEVLQPFNQNDSDSFKNEYIRTLCTFFRNDKIIRHALVHRRNVHPVNLIVGATP
jgi:adenine-specific DNA-methyltransferase